ncbi:MAG: ABC transporter permease [Oscillospiraceae bacterium]|nr:ABC transporter permease [Oscillospiraceae bacterium]
MTKYVIKRIGYMIIVFFVVSFLMYSVYNLIPSDPARAELEPLKQTLKPAEYEERYQQLREEYGLDDPIPVRYARWMGLAKDTRTDTFHGMLQGYFGFSQVYKKDVAEIIPDRMENTIFINIFSTILALGITIPLGIYCAVHKKGKIDNITQVITIIGYSIPVYIIALIFIWIFAVWLGIFPVTGSQTPGADYTGMRAFLDRLYYICLPVIVMTFGSLGGMTRYVRAAMIEALSQDYIRTARAKGLREKVVIYSHAWRNALLPVITVIIGWFLGIFGGSVIIENTFGLNGMGALYYVGLMNNDFELALSIQMFYIVVSLLGQLAMDLSYGLVDPRVRVDK